MATCCATVLADQQRFVAAYPGCRWWGRKPSHVVVSYDDATEILASLQRLRKALYAIAEAYRASPPQQHSVEGLSGTGE
jgi:hypothetical protein